MPSLRELQAAHARLLVLDAASAQIQVGLLDRGGDARWATNGEEAGVGLFRGIEELGVRVDTVDAFLFCDGPGSILGIRTVAMALRTWNVLSARPVFAYCSLALLAHAPGLAEVGVIADARRDHWHHYRLGGSLQRVPTAALAGELVTPDNFRHWSVPPPNVRRVPYTLAALLPASVDVGLFHPAAAPDAFLHEEPSYVTWTPQIHRAPAPPP